MFGGSRRRLSSFGRTQRAVVESEEFPGLDCPGTPINKCHQERFSCSEFPLREGKKASDGPLKCLSHSSRTEGHRVECLWNGTCRPNRALWLWNSGFRN